MDHQIRQNSVGDYECPVCKAAYLTKGEAANCMQSHVVITEDLKTTVAITDALCVVDKYKENLDKGNSLKAGSDLILDMIEDYMIARKRDMVEKGKVSSLTLQLAKNAAQALNDYNKLVFGEKKSTVSVSMKGDQKDSMEAFKDLLTKSSERRAKIIDVEEPEVMPDDD